MNLFLVKKKYIYKKIKLIFMKKTLLFFLFPVLSFAQIKIGETIIGKYPVSSTSASFFGTILSFSNDGSILAIGDKSIWSGTVWVHKNTAGSWTQYGSKFSNGNGPDEKGKSICLSTDGNMIAVGSPQGAGNGTESGFAEVYQNKEGVWTQIGADIEGRSSGEYSGSSVALSGDGSVIAIGAPGNSRNNFHAGCVRAYKNINGVWTKIGVDLNGKESVDEFGNKVMLSKDGEIMGVGTYNKSVYVYRNIAGTWTLLGNEISGNNFNLSLTADGLTIAVSCTVVEYTQTERLNVPYVKVFKFINGSWTQVGASLKARIGIGSGLSISGDGSILAVGAPDKDEKGDESGTVRVYKNVAGNWTQIGVDIKGEAQYDKNGAGVVLSGDGTKLAVGSPYNDNITGIDAGSVRVYNLIPLLSTDSFVMSNFSVYPNPTSNEVNISLKENLVLEKVNIYNVMGQLIKTEKSNVIKVNSLSKGTYYFEIFTDKGKGTKAIIVK